MYSRHNFYFKPILFHLHSCRSLIVRVLARGLSNRKHLFNTGRITHLPMLLTQRTPNAIAEWIAFWFSGICVCAPSWTIVDHSISHQHPRARALVTWEKITLSLVAGTERYQMLGPQEWWIPILELFKLGINCAMCMKPVTNSDPSILMELWKTRKFRIHLRKTLGDTFCFCVTKVRAFLYDTESKRQHGIS